MAKDTTLKIIDMQSFIGWEADNPYMWPANCCVRALNVDIRTKPWIVQLENTIEWTRWYSWLITAMYRVYDWRRILVCTTEDFDSWQIRMWDDITLSVDSPIYRVFEDEHEWAWTASKETLYYVWKKGTTCYIYRSKYPDVAVENVWNFTDYSLSSKNSIPYILCTNGKIYIWVWSVIYTLDDVWVLTHEMSVPYEEIIVWMTEYLWTIKIYTQKKWLEKISCLYTWDWVDYLPSTRQVYQWLKFSSVVNDWACDYVLSTDSYLDEYAGEYEWWRWEIYLFAWTQKQKILVADEKENWKTFYTLLWFADWKLYISWTVKTKEQDSNMQWVEKRKTAIFTYWAKYPWMSNSFCTAITTDAQIPFTMWDISPYEWSIVANIDWISEFNQDYNKWWYFKDRKFENWYIDSMYYTIDQWKNMAFEMMKMKVKMNGWTIKIYYRTRLEDNWKTFKYIPSDYENEKITISIREFNENNPWEFVWIQFRFELIRWNDSSKSPEIWRITAFLREIDENI